MNITKYQNSVSFTTIDDPEIVKNELFKVFQSKLDIFFISCFMAFASLIAGYNILAKIIIPIVIFLIFYGLNVSICILRYKHFIKKTITEYLEKDIPSLTKEQEEWIADDSKCDACGAHLKPSDKYCQKCGLLVRIDI